MTKEEFDQKWDGIDTETMDDATYRQFKNDCFDMYESTGFVDVFHSPYSDEEPHNGMKFQVVRRATNIEVDIEAQPMWVVKFENGHEGYCFPEEICKVENPALA